MATPIGPILDGIGITTDLGDGLLVAGAIVILKLVDPTDGTVILRQDWNDGLAIYERVGMLDAIRARDLKDAISGREYDDD